MRDKSSSSNKQKIDRNQVRRLSLNFVEDLFSEITKLIEI